MVFIKILYKIFCSLFYVKYICAVICKHCQIYEINDIVIRKDFIFRQCPKDQRYVLFDQGCLNFALLLLRFF